MEDYRETLELKHFKRLLADYEYINVRLKETNELSESGYLAKQMSEIERYLEVGECKEQVWKLFCKPSSTYEKEAQKLYMDARTLRRRIDKDILDFLKMSH